MDKVLQNPIVKWFINIPWLWNLAQDIIGENQWKREMYTSVVEKRGGTLLDFGCSIGNETDAFLDFDYTGIDVDPLAIKAAQERFKEHANVKFICADVIKEPPAKDQFDHVLFAATGHHLTDEELRKIIPILMASLRSGGLLHFLDHIRRPGKDGWFAKLIIRIDQGRYIRTEEAYRRFFDQNDPQVTRWELIESPKKLLKLPDFLYIRMIK